MAGYLFTFSDIDSLKACVKTGMYSTRMGLSWSLPTTATLGDYVTMKPGDNVYFFSKRSVYGIGEIVSIRPESVFWENRDGVTSGKSFSYESASLKPLMEESPALLQEGKVNRWVICFKPSPSFFQIGIDMDELLQSSPSSFKSLRTFWKRSFIKLDDEENRAFKASILRAQMDDCCNVEHAPAMECNWESTVASLALDASLLQRIPDIDALIATHKKPDGSLSNEMLLEVGLLNQLSGDDYETNATFGSWDYLAHQVYASPFKPIDYMDKIDIFGYRWIPGYEGEVIGRYLVVELKKGAASVDDYAQVMKYVDWVCAEYAHGDYSLIDAYLVAMDFNDDVESAFRGITERNYVVGQHPAKLKTWNNLSLVRYEVQDAGHISFGKSTLTITGIQHFAEMQFD